MLDNLQTLKSYSPYPEALMKNEKQKKGTEQKKRENVKIPCKIQVSSAISGFTKCFQWGYFRRG